MTKKKTFNLNQLSLPFGQGRTRAISYDDRAKAFWFLAGASLFALATYVYAVNATAHHVAERAALEREATELSADLASLEFQSIALKSDITLEVAKRYGFEEASQPLYISRKADAALSFNTERP